MGDLFRTAIICDHITVDIGRKHSLIGVYSGDVIIQKFPAKLRFAIYAELLPRRVGDYKLTVQISLNDKEVAKAEIEAAVRVAEAPLVFILPAIGLNIEEETVLKVEVRPENGEVFTLVSKKIRSEGANEPET